MVKEKLRTKDFINITIITFFIFLSFYIPLTALPIYLADELSGGADQAGLLLTAFLIAAIIVRPFAGKWVKRGAEKKAFIYAAAACFAASLMYPFVTDFELLLLLRIIHGIAFGIVSNVKGTISSLIIPASKRGEGLSYFSLSIGLAMVIGPVTGLNFADIGAYMTSFIICIAVSAISIILVFFLKVPEPTETEVLVKKKKLSWDDLLDRNAAPYAITLFMLAFAYSGVVSFLSLYAKEVDLVKAASTFFMIYAVTMLVESPFTGVWSDRYGANKIIYACVIIFGVGMFLLQLPPTALVMIVAGAIIGLGYGSVQPIFQAQIINSVEQPCWYRQFLVFQFNGHGDGGWCICPRNCR